MVVPVLPGVTDEQLLMLTWPWATDLSAAAVDGGGELEKGVVVLRGREGLAYELAGRGSLEERKGVVCVMCA
jgi:hypothetical protein